MRLFIERLSLSGIFAFCCLLIHIDTVSAKDTPLKVGFVLPLSGGLTEMGQAFRRGIALYGEEHSGFSKWVVFQYEDHRYDGKATVSALHKLRDTDKVDIVVIWGNTPSGSSAPIAERIKMPMVAISMNPDAKGKKHVISFGPKIEPLVDKVIEKFSEWKLSKPAAVTVDIGNAILGVEMLKEKLDGELFVKIVASEETDFKTLLTQLKLKGVDGLFLLTLPNQALTFLRQATQQKFSPKIVGGDVFAEDIFQKKAGEFPLELTYVYGAVEDRFIKKLKQRFDTSSYFYEAASGYTLASLLHQLAKKRSDNPKIDVIREFRNLKRDDTPIVGLRVLDDDEYGLHYENDAYVYDARR